ncbi:hypothetical protein PCANC_23837 [Puccinia coronata f. sp. avenae]|uniref:Uncharacterized protein n=1 Tax=Puccinia coronata f. sp. avenae TaxID=200324 RepID=A0A2N5U5Y6_9BASI|nr:hypothetical protein PCANC_23837 [Puccinia coronata f. sp. avenae]
MPLASSLPALTGRTRLLERCSNSRVRPVFGRHCPTEARANWSDRFVRPVPAGPVQPVPGTDRTGLSDPPAGASVGQCLSTTGRTRLFEHRSNCRVRPVNAGSALIENWIICCFLVSLVALSGFDMTVIRNPIYSFHRSSHSHSLSPSTEKNRVLPAPDQPIAKKMGGDISVLDQNILYICNKMHSLKTKLSPKEFIHAFVISAEPKVSYLRRHWAQPKGINSTMALVDVIGHEIKKTPSGREAWATFIQQEAIKILQSEEPPRGNYPVGGFHSSASVNQDFFTLEEKEAHSTQLVKHMPFLYKTLMGILNPNNMVFPVEPEESPSSKNNNPKGAAREDIPEDIASIAYEDSHQGPEGHHRRLETVVKTICAMVAFSQNRRNNGLQLHNAVRFFSCGISERVQEYMN